MNKCQPTILCFFLIGILFLFAGKSSYASHNRAGEITYKYMGGTKFEITVTTYTKKSSCNADRCTIVVSYSDGDKDTVQRINGFPCPITSGPPCNNGSEPPCNKCGELIPGTDIKKNVYRTEHIFTGSFTYTVSVDDPNRNSNIVNINNSANISFFIKTELVISPFLGYNSSPVLTFPPIDQGCFGQPFYHNPGAIDPDNDSLSYTLVGCYGAGGFLIPVYKFPNEINPGANNQLSIDPITGEVKWISPQMQGEYNLCILITEYRNGVKIGSVLRDMQITINPPCINKPPQIAPLSPVCVVAGTNLLVDVVANDPDPDHIRLTATGEIFSLPNPATFTKVDSISGYNKSRLQWQTNCNNVRSQPYLVTFKAQDDDDSVKLVDFESLQITVVAPPPVNPKAVPFANTVNLSWGQGFCTNALGYTVYKRIDSIGFIPGPCQTGVPASTGYSVISPCAAGLSLTDNNNGTGLSYGQKYCYIVTACMPGDIESIASPEFCTELKRDVPIITHVTINTTDSINGSDSVKWSKPTELDTVQYQGPYHYKIFRSKGLETPVLLVGTTNSNSLLSFVDTFFVDTPLNTRDSQYNYKVEVYYNNTGLIGSAQTASSVFLSSSPTDNKLNLSWKAVVPWVNNSFVVYKKNPSGLFDSIATVTTTAYSDSNLINGETYCYFIKSIGEYSVQNIEKPLLNRSQILCSTPVDNVAPCSPVKPLLQSSCEFFENKLQWDNPNNKCADDIVGYRIYYTPRFNQEMILLDSVTSSNDTSIVYNNLSSVAGCYAVVAVDTFRNESLRSDTTCVDNCPVYELPNVFTPGGDGVNDFLKPFPYRFIHRITLQIYNRWGEVVFETENPDILWDGHNTKTKMMCTAGVYYYICQVHEARLHGSQTRLLKGYVHLLPESSFVGPSK